MRGVLTFEERLAGKGERERKNGIRRGGYRRGFASFQRQNLPMGLEVSPRKQILLGKVKGFFEGGGWSWLS